MSRDEKLYVGINKDLKEITVTIPDADPKPWDGKDDLKHIGKKVTRIDGTYKTTGRAKYTYDIQLPGMVPEGGRSGHGSHRRKSPLPHRGPGACGQARGGALP